MRFPELTLLWKEKNAQESQAEGRRTRKEASESAGNLKISDVGIHGRVPVQQLSSPTQ